MSFRSILSIATLVLVLLVLFLARDELMHAWHLMAQVNVWILALLIPLQLFVYYCAGEMIFSYLRAKKAVDAVPPSEQIKIALEMNFVNHVMPTGGVSGVSYTTWRLSKLGVSPGQATMAQVVRYAMQLVAFIILLGIAVIMVTIDGTINRWVILVSSGLVSIMIAAIVAGMYLFSSAQRCHTFAGWLVQVVNPLIRRVTFGKVPDFIKRDVADEFLDDMHRDYLGMRHDRRILLKPLLWGIAFTLCDAMLFYIVFLALGTPVNPAPVLIAYSVATLTGLVVVTPGGAGAYEVVMAGFLTIAGIDNSTAIAGIVLTRVIVMLGTIGFGYIFYQKAIVKYGKRKIDATT